ncbi:MAG: hypothetical protein JOS17DRAFT_733111 [Linnemannia elongata]|nr:MAG: hypothetical protein JOS17DRAFT_733111 [Linnemannia elongata]
MSIHARRSLPWAISIIELLLSLPLLTSFCLVVNILGRGCFNAHMDSFQQDGSLIRVRLLQISLLCFHKTSPFTHLCGEIEQRNLLPYLPSHSSPFYPVYCQSSAHTHTSTHPQLCTTKAHLFFAYFLNSHVVFQGMKKEMVREYKRSPDVRLAILSFPPLYPQQLLHCIQDAKKVYMWSEQERSKRG